MRLVPIVVVVALAGIVERAPARATAKTMLAAVVGDNVQRALAQAVLFVKAR